MRQSIRVSAQRSGSGARHGWKNMPHQTRMQISKDKRGLWSRRQMFPAVQHNNNNNKTKTWWIFKVHNLEKKWFDNIHKASLQQFVNYVALGPTLPSRRTATRRSRRDASSGRRKGAGKNNNKQTGFSKRVEKQLLEIPLTISYSKRIQAFPR